MALFSFELGPTHIDGLGGHWEVPVKKLPPNLHQECTWGDIVKSEKSELNRKTGKLNRNMNVNKMSYLAPAGTCTGTQAGHGRCDISECALVDAALLLAVQSNIHSCGQVCSCHMH